MMIAVMMRMRLAGFRAVMRGVGAMAGRAVGVMRRRLVIVFVIVTGSFAMMLRGLFVVIGGVRVMFACRMLLRHGRSPSGVIGPLPMRRD
jgi:hypothetical protein